MIYVRMMNSSLIVINSEYMYSESLFEPKFRRISNFIMHGHETKTKPFHIRVLFYLNSLWYLLIKINRYDHLIDCWCFLYPFSHTLQNHIFSLAMNSPCILFLVVSYVVQFALSGKLSEKRIMNIDKLSMALLQPKYCSMSRWSKKCLFFRKFQRYMLRWYGLWWNDFQQRNMCNCWYQWKMLFLLLSFLPRSVSVQEPSFDK